MTKNAEAARKYRAAHPDRIKESRKRRYAARLVELRKYSREYNAAAYADNPYKFRARVLKRARVPQQIDKKRDDRLGLGASTHLHKQVETQEGKCAICANAFKKTPCLDHDHETGRWRGAVCNTCNLVLGYAYENAETLRRAAEYLIFWGTK